MKVNEMCGSKQAHLCEWSVRVCTVLQSGVSFWTCRVKRGKMQHTRTVLSKPASWPWVLIFLAQRKGRQGHVSVVVWTNPL